MGIAGLKVRHWSYCEATQRALAPILPLLCVFPAVVKHFKEGKSPMGMERRVTKQEDDVCWRLREDEESSSPAVYVWWD